MLAGPEQAFNLFDSSSLRVSLDLAHIKQGGQEVILSKELVRTPSNISVLSIKPDRIHIIAYRLLPVSLPVEVRTTGTTPPGISLQKIEAMPATLKVLVPPKLVNSNGLRLRTKPIDLKNVSSSVTLNSDIILPPNARFLTDRPPQVLVNIKIKQKAN